MNEWRESSSRKPNRYIAAVSTLVRSPPDIAPTISAMALPT